MLNCYRNYTDFLIASQTVRKKEGSVCTNNDAGWFRVLARHSVSAFLLWVISSKRSLVHSPRAMHWRRRVTSTFDVWSSPLQESSWCRSMHTWLRSRCERRTSWELWVSSVVSRRINRDECSRTCLIFSLRLLADFGTWLRTASTSAWINFTR